MKKIISIIMLLCLLTGTAFAAASVTYEGGAEKFVFLPGSEYSDSDLFENFKGVLPGDALTQQITVKNATDGKVRIYMRAEDEGMEDTDFLSQLHMTVEETAVVSSMLESARSMNRARAETEEKDLNPQMPAIIGFIQSECLRQKQISEAAPDDHKHDYTELNTAFRRILCYE